MAHRLLVTGASILAATSQTGGDGQVPGVCPTTTASLTAAHFKFHADNVCNRTHYDSFKRSLGRHLTHQRFVKSGQHNLVPNQKTLVCPSVVNDLTSPEGITGYDTSWIVENTASTPIVLAWLDQNGVEHSAMDTTITPPEADIKAILLPGEWRHIHTYEGHVFHAREFNPQDGSTGKVLLQHRAGLIPVGSKARHLLTCPTDDPEPIKVIEETGANIRDPHFSRSFETELKECNLMDLGFRNMAGCPLHVYWQKPDSCDEVFKFHLGTNGYANDFTWDWDSPTKFESTKLAHTFVFRSPAQPDIVVDSVTLQPTQVCDCPDLKQTVAMPVALDAAIVLPVGHVVPTNNTTTTAANATNVSASSRTSTPNYDASILSALYGSYSLS